MSLVIRVKDEVGSFFCGFKEDEIGISGVLLSRSKENAIQYSDNDEARNALIKIIQVTHGDLLGGVQKYVAAPNILEDYGG